MQAASNRFDLIIFLYFSGGKYLCFIQFLLSLFINWWKKQDSQYLGHENQEHQEDIQGWAFQPENNLRTVPTFFSAHTFCTSRKARFKRHACAGVDIDAINYATKCTTKMKAAFSYCDQIKFNEPVLKPGTPEYM